jgi:hypothetical protein
VDSRIIPKNNDLTTTPKIRHGAFEVFSNPDLLGYEILRVVSSYYDRLRDAVIVRTSQSRFDGVDDQSRVCQS